MPIKCKGFSHSSKLTNLSRKQTMSIPRARAIITMKIKVTTIRRDPENYARETKNDINKVFRNFDKTQHLFEAEREYSRALNAVKVDKMLSKPFISSLEGHSDGVNCLERHPTKLKVVASSSYDHQIRIWNLSSGETTSKINNAHKGTIQGISFNPNGESLCSVAVDNIIKLWSYKDTQLKFQDSIVSSTSLMGVHHSRSTTQFGTCGDGIHIYDLTTQTPIQHFTFGVDSVKTFRFHPIEANVMASAVTDRSIILYDIRQSTPTAKVVLAMRTNALSWNPMEAPYFVLANEDSNVYAFDMRKLSKPYRRYGDHTNAVLDVDFSPTGQEFVSGSYDRSLRIFPFLGASFGGVNCSRDVYYTKRMQRIFCVRYSGDSEYVLSGSDEMNIRIWKSTASKKLGYLRPREKKSINYNKKLVERFQHHPEIKQIKNRKHLPNYLYQQSEQQKTLLTSLKRKEENIRLFRKEIPQKRKTVVYKYDDDSDNSSTAN